MRASDRPSAFTSDSARDRYFAAYGRVLGELWPAPADAIDVETRAGSVRIHRAGPAEGDPVILLAGAGGNALAWYRYIEPLARMRPVFAIDPLGEPGCSVQRQPLANGAEVGGWLTDVLAALGAERAHMVGSSYGGWTVMEQQLGGGGRVSALTLVDPVGFAPLTGRFYRWVIVGGMAALLPRALRRRIADTVGNGTLREDVLMKLIAASRSFRRRLPIPPAYTDEQVRELSVPVQVLLGARSALHDAQAVAARLAEIAPSWRVEIVPDAGHALPVEAPDLVIERILTFPGQVQAEIATPEHDTDRG
ncbi:MULTISPECIES: alpha/beta fold hydrolase [Streptosporangium]|uniref:Pimeloyl-ACP methyl ester carboxylesterase n=1 Tax=Streptosporangium brasiliense TaxID=47480 RepID=A0ABT9RJ24_9ACTN|nr:alpha/beta fold hydrolase [Streptosporangium brasiliense]MDP9868345.1 pimeloyl-ACP methyl ester carboxylesterase [Streptosporangium brasiliense]